MQKRENQKPTHHDVMPSMAKFLSDLWFEGDFREQPHYLSEIFKRILETDLGDDKDLRSKMMECIKTSEMLAETLEPFSDKQIQKACNKIITA
ncbi:hypothetical protein [Flavobacterium phragmitis]|uniref:Uncharacterized protein n=1 Tax=Flavobacterium phragmitis TaxID=739143 RepID=A0A1I1JV80_9FLAO|nr:hypothetical protein [Flavobacterium phragmitis]SFC50388.1 hypothetical protein SAMN05216297_10153 [Flavobacterium phragmitis]